MNPNEIKKALECCINCDCKNCPYDTENEGCKGIDEEEILAYINQLEEKNDDLERDTIPKLQWSLKRANECGIKTDKENQKLKAEVERLEKENLKLSNEVEYLLTKRLSGEDKTDVMAMCCETLEKIRQDLQITEIKRTIQDLKIAMKSDRDFEDIMNGTYEKRKEGEKNLKS